MSKVFSFRLDADNPREAQAKDVIDTWLSQGYSIRYIITSALIKYGKNDEIYLGWENLFLQLSNLARVLEEGENEKNTSYKNQNLSPNFISALRNSVKKGIDSDNI